MAAFKIAKINIKISKFIIKNFNNTFNRYNIHKTFHLPKIINLILIFKIIQNICKISRFLKIMFSLKTLVKTAVMKKNKIHKVVSIANLLRKILKNFIVRI